MTRLIDADALIDKVDKYIYRITRASKLKVGESAIIADIKAHIELSPTIDAIPIEFIQKRIDQLKEMNGRIFIENGGYTSPSDYEQWELERLIRDWRDSNE